MKKLLVFVAVCLMALTTFATELNIYASGLKAGGMSADKKVQVEYLLNAPATTLTIEVLNADQSVALSVPVTEASALTKGNHAVTLDLATLAEGSYAWRVTAAAEANAEATKVTGTESRFNFYTPEGIAVDNSFESPYFGRVYVTESREGLATGAGRTTHQGVYIYNAALEDATNQVDNAYAGGVAWTESTTAIGGLIAAMSSPARIKVDEEGNVFIVDNARISADENYSAVWMMDPANPSANFKAALDVTKRGTLFTRINDVVVTGKGENRVMWVNDWTDAIVRYPIGLCETPYSVQPVAADSVIILATHNILNGYNSLGTDGHGGFWIFQYRGQLDAYPIITHFNAQYQRDFYIASDNNNTSITGGNKRGGGAVSPDGSMVALNTEISSVKKIVVLKATYNENGIDTVTEFVSVPGYTNVEGFAFDVAGNLYIASASSEYFEAYALPKADNSFTTPAPAAQAIVITNTIVNVTGVTLDAETADMKVGEQKTLVATITPDNATNKSVTWSSSDETIATVTAEGQVTALKAGVDTITVKTADGEKTASCVITITNVDVDSVELNRSHIYIYPGDNNQLTTTIAPANATIKDVTYASSDTAVATVSAEGLITAVAPGEATVTVTTVDGGKTASCIVTVNAPEYPNVMAYGLKLDKAEGLTVGFNLNAPATQVQVIAYDSLGEEYVVATAANMAPEYQTLALNTDELPAGTYTWAVKANGVEDEEAFEPVLVHAYTTPKFIKPRGVAMDNNYNSPYFGQIYVADAGSAADNSGLYIFDPVLAGDGEIHTTGWSASPASPMRPHVGEDGLVYITDWSDNAGNIHIFDPAMPDSNMVVFGGTFSGAGGIWNTEDGKYMHGSFSSCYVTGTGADRVLYAFDEDVVVDVPKQAYRDSTIKVMQDGVEVDSVIKIENGMDTVKRSMAMLRYDIGALETPWAAAPSAVAYNNADNFEQNGDSKIIPSVMGGWWISQDRATDSQAIPALIHVAADGSVNYNSSATLGGRTRGALAFNEDQTLCLTAADNAIRLWDVTWSEDGVPTLTLSDQAITTTFGSQNSSSCYDIAIDRALNVYASGDNKPLCIWALVKDENSCITPAADALTFTVEKQEDALDNVTAQKALRGVYDILGRYLGEKVDDMPMGVYIVNGEKVIK